MIEGKRYDIKCDVWSLGQSCKVTSTALSHFATFSGITAIEMAELLPPHSGK